MEFHQLRYFCAIAESGGFSRAARLTHVSQPSLSQQIHKLEEELGARLFDRIGRTVRLTEVGRAFLPRARALLSDLEAARSTVVEGGTWITGSVCVGGIPPLLLERVGYGAVDVAVVAVPLQMRGHEFQSFPLIEEKLYAALPKQHKLAKRRRITLGELQDEPFLLLRDGHCFRETAVAACKRARVRPKIIFESGQFSSILSMVCAGLGVSIIPAMALEKRSGCQFVPLADGRATRAIGAVTLNGRSLSRVQQAFLAHLTAKIASKSAHLAR